MFPDLAVAGPRALHAVEACDNFHFKPPAMARFRPQAYLHAVTLVEPATDSTRLEVDTPIGHMPQPVQLGGCTEQAVPSLV